MLAIVQGVYQQWLVMQGLAACRARDAHLALQGEQCVLGNVYLGKAASAEATQGSNIL